MAEECQFFKEKFILHLLNTRGKKKETNLVTVFVMKHHLIEVKSDKIILNAFFIKCFLH